MTIMIQIGLPDDLAKAVEVAFPANTLGPAVEQWLRAEIEKKAAVEKRANDLLQSFRRIREQSLPTSDAEIRAIRDELQS